MRRCIAHGLAIGGLIVGLGATQGPNSSEAKPAPGSSVLRKLGIRRQLGGTKPYEVGTATWYGENFEGKDTASGEKYNMYDLTAAHLTLPFGSYVQVTNLRNGRAVVVRVNDRGPIVPGRIIDLSYGAARALEMKAHGLQQVRLDLVSTISVGKASPTKPAYQTIASNHPPVALIP
jgi:rare lipoprotein A